MIFVKLTLQSFEDIRLDSRTKMQRQSGDALFPLRMLYLSPRIHPHFALTILLGIFSFIG